MLCKNDHSYYKGSQREGSGFDSLVGFVCHPCIWVGSLRVLQLSLTSPKT